MAAYENRERARTALKGNWMWAALTTFVASLLGGVAQSGGRANTEYRFEETQNIPVGEVGGIVGDIGEAGEIVGNVVAEYAPVIGGAAIILLAIAVIYLMLGSVVGLGYRKYTLSLIDIEPAEFKQLFSQFHRLWQAVLMRLLVGLVETALVLLLAALMAPLILLVPVLAILLMPAWLVAAIYISYGFVLTDFIMAEDEHCTAMEALKRSWMLMKGQRWSYFCLGFSFIGWAILSAFTFGIGGLFLTPYIQVSYAAFYRDLKPKATGYRPDDGYTDYAGVNHEFL